MHIQPSQASSYKHINSTQIRPIIEQRPPSHFQETRFSGQKNTGKKVLDVFLTTISTISAGIFLHDLGTIGLIRSGRISSDSHRPVFSYVIPYNSPPDGLATPKHRSDNFRDGGHRLDGKNGMITQIKRLFGWQ